MPPVTSSETRTNYTCQGSICTPSERLMIDYTKGRRMAEGAALLVDHVLPAVGYRQ